MQSICGHEHILVESKTQTYHERFGSGGRTAGQDGVYSGTPTGRSAQKSTVPLAPQGIEDNCRERLFGSTNKGILM